MVAILKIIMALRYTGIRPSPTITKVGAINNAPPFASACVLYFIDCIGSKFRVTPIASLEEQYGGEALNDLSHLRD